MSGSGPVVFNWAIWSARYPALACKVSEATAAAYWCEAGLFLDNSGCGQVPATRLPLILGMITAHLVCLPGNPGSDSPASLPGRIASAAQGSVNVATEYTSSQASQWWDQTEYGATAWQALAPYRTARYIAAPQRPLSQQSYPWALSPVFFPRG